MPQTYEGRLSADGEFREAESGNRYEVVNPTDESVVATAADASTEHGIAGFRDYLPITTIVSHAR